MAETEGLGFADRRPWDARLARWLVMPLRSSWVLPNHLTTVRLLVGLAAVAAFLPGTYRWSNAGALLLVLSNFLDHTDGELARLSGKISRFGHVYDLASDAAVTVLLFTAIGIGLGGPQAAPFELPLLGAVAGGAPAVGAIAGGAIAFIFYVRMRIEDLAGKSATRQAALAGFETEDIMYLVPLVTLSNGLRSFLIAAAVCAPLYAAWVAMEYRLRARQLQRQSTPSAVP